MIISEGSMYNNIYRGKTVLVTGHTGFKGSWLAIWLLKLGAKVIGFSLEESSNDNLFKASGIKEKLIDVRGNLENITQLRNVFETFNPEFVFHLAAQPLVRKSYDFPRETFISNTMGTLNVLDCINNAKSVQSALIITTDKVYEDKECWQGYSETNPLAGYGDPYSCSKACAEIVVNSYRKSFFTIKQKLVATARAGNVLGGGDYGADRILPDCINSLSKGTEIIVRNPYSIRPWQYILDVLNGYLLLGQNLMERKENIATAWNIGPLLSSIVTVEELVREVVSVWGSGAWRDVSKEGNGNKKEAPLLNLDISKTYFELGFKPQYSIKETILHTVNWYKQFDGSNAFSLCLKDINNFEERINCIGNNNKEINREENNNKNINNERNSNKATNSEKNNDVKIGNGENILKQCRYCKSEEVIKFLDYGLIPLVNNLLNSMDQTKTEEKFPLNLYFCKSCGLVQIGKIVPPEKMFSNYLYFSSTSSTFRKHCFEFSKSVKEKFRLDKNSFVVEIASNDGTALKSFKELQIPFLGIDPAENIVKIANENGLNTTCAYFNSQVAEEVVMEKGKADLVFGMNVFAHIPEVHDFVLGMKKMIKENGTIVIEAPYIVDFIKNTEFDTVYHEHVNYLGLHAMQKLFNKFDLDLFDVEWEDIHGGSMRYFFCNKGVREKSQNVQKYLNLEIEEKILEIETYFSFASKVETLKEELLTLLKKLKFENKKIVGYAASAKGIVLLNYCGIGIDYLDFVIDKSLYKQNHLIPGLHLEIKSPDFILSNKPDYILLLAWNFKKEIMQEQQDYINAGGKFIIPIPKPEIVGEKK